MLFVLSELYTGPNCHDLVLVLVPNNAFPNLLYFFTSSPSVQVGKDSLSPMERAVSLCTTNVMQHYEIEVLIPSSTIIMTYEYFTGRKGAHGFGH